MFIAAVTTAGDMSYLDVKNECGKESWVPLVVYEFENQTILPLFKTEEICKKWLGRNLSKDWMPNGCCFLTEQDVAFVEERGWNIRFFEWQNKVKDYVDFRVEVITLTENPSVHAR